MAMGKSISAPPTNFGEPVSLNYFHIVNIKMFAQSPDMFQVVQNEGFSPNNHHHHHINNAQPNKGPNSFGTKSKWEQKYYGNDNEHAL